MAFINKKESNSNNDMGYDFRFHPPKKALIIFTRNPELGKCKTRLAHSIGDEAALNIYKHLLNHTAWVSKQVKADKFVFYSENIIRDDIWESSIFKKKLQNGKDLGKRMEQAFAELFNLGYKKAIIIGSDLLDLEPEAINKAFEELDNNDFVLGPAKDGGYYLLGMKTLKQNLFKNKAWGSETVLRDTLDNLQNSKVHLLHELNDIDTFNDIKDYQELKKYYTPYD